MRHIAAILRHTVAIWRDIAAYFGVVVDKGRRVCGAKIFSEHEFTLVARIRIAALGKVKKRRGNIAVGQIGAGKAVRSGSCSPFYVAAADVRNTWTICGGGRC